MDWRRTLPVLVLLLNGWIAIGFMPKTFAGPVSLVLFASLTGVGILAGLTVKGEPKEGEQNFLAVSLILVLLAAIGLTVVVRYAPRYLDDAGLLWIMYPVWAGLSGYTAGRFWSVPEHVGPEGQKEKDGPAATKPADPLEKDRGAT